MKNLLSIILAIGACLQVTTQKRIDYPDYGLSFEVPAGWIGQENGNTFIMGHQTIPGFIILTLHDAPDIQTLKQEAQAGLQDTNGTNLTAISSPKLYGSDGISCAYEGTIEREQAKAFGIALMSPNGGGVTILVAASSSLFSSDYQQYAYHVAQSVEFRKIEKADVSDEWKEALSNVRLTYMDSYSSNTSGGGGYSSESKIDLCAEGYFNYRDSDINAFGQYAGAYSQNKGGGTWSLESGKSTENPVLKLSFYDGTVYSYELSYKDNKLYLNGYRYFRTYANDPTEEFRPQCN